MLLFILLCVTLLLSTSHSANVLVIAGLRGSHFYVSADIADKLVEFGHNVTVVTMFSDTRVDMTDRAFHFIAVADENEAGSFFKRWDTILKRFIHRPSTDMVVDLIVSQAKDEDVKSWIDDYNNLALKYFQGDEFAGLLDTGKFELIVLEEGISLLAMVHLTHQDIPIMGLVCHAGARDNNDRFGLPGLINSIPSYSNDITDSPPTFVERWQTLVRIGRFFAAVITIIQSMLQEVPVEDRKSIEEYFMAVFDVVFINDHPAYSFPFLSAPNTFYLGPFNLEDRPFNPLPEDYQEFLTNCPHKHTVFFSFGSYLEDITTFSGTPAILETLRKMDVCVIMKSKVDLSMKFDLPAGKFLQRAWIPQKDLLGSGKLDFFISHCGNNGRLEAIYYNIPLLCIPMFGDQYYNARLVVRNRFGLLLTWETLTEVTLTQTIDNLFTEQDTFVANMKRAVDIARNDPGAGTDVLRFYTDLLIKNKNADYLVNRIILNQSIIEIYNLDIAAVALIVTMCVIVGILFCLTKCFKFCCRKITNKIKTD